VCFCFNDKWSASFRFLMSSGAVGLDISSVFFFVSLTNGVRLPSRFLQIETESKLCDLWPLDVRK
jgi:hypothetical protein